MPRVAIKLKCEPKVLQELERLSRSRTEEARLVERVRIILACLSGKRNDEVAAEHDTQPGTVGIWRRRFAAEDKFAHLVGISVGTLRNWEQGRRKPEGPARVLLRVASLHPEALLDIAGEQAAKAKRPTSLSTRTARKRAAG